MTDKEALAVLQLNIQRIENKSLKEAMEAAIKALEEKIQRDWVYCTERMPRRKFVDSEDEFRMFEYESDPVLVRDTKGNVSIAVFAADSNLDYRDCWWRRDRFENAMTSEIVAWRPFL